MTLRTIYLATVTDGLDPPRGGRTVIEFEAITGCTLDRDGQRVSLRRGARLRVTDDDGSLNWRQIERLVRDNRLRCVAGRYALAERLTAERLAGELPSH